MRKIGFELSNVDECVFYRNNTIFFFYVDDGVFVGSSQDEIDSAIRELRDLKYNLEENRDIQDYIGINFQINDDNSIRLTQPHLIQ